MNLIYQIFMLVSTASTLLVFNLLSRQVSSLKKIGYSVFLTIAVFLIYLLLNQGNIQSLGYYREVNNNLSQQIGMPVDDVIASIRQKLKSSDNQAEQNKMLLSLAKLEWSVGYYDQALIDLQQISNAALQQQITLCTLSVVSNYGYEGCGQQLEQVSINALPD